MNQFRALTAALAASSSAIALAGAPSYTIINIGVVNAGDSGSQGFRVSDNGIATGRSLGTGSRAYRWTETGGLEPLPNLAAPVRNFNAGNGVNIHGVVVGTGATTAFGSDPLPLIWTNGTVNQLVLPLGHSLGRANDINNLGVAVGSVGSGVNEFGVIYDGDTATIITTATPGGATLRTAFSINDSGRIVGFGIDPNNAARNVGFVYDIASGTAFEVGALPGLNGALAFDVSNAGHVVGATMLNQGSGMPFIWTDAGGMVAIPLPVGTSQGSARGVNSNGWVVGNSSSAFAIPFLYDGVNTYRVADLIPDGTGWDLSNNTSSSALSISESGVIVGTGVFNGQVRAYAMIPAGAGCNAADLVEPFGVLDLADIQAFALAFTNADPAADLVPPFGVFDLADIQAFVAAFTAGCP